MRLLITFCLVFIFSCSTPTESSKPNSNIEKEKIMNTSNTRINEKIDWQGHRGCRGIMPENSLPAFLKALEFPEISTLELDIAISKDKKVIVSHEPWFNHTICDKPNGGGSVTEEEEKDLKIYEMTYEEIKQYDCGSRGNARFPDQVKMKVYKPSLEEMVKRVDAACEQMNRAKPNYDIEVKSDPKYYGKFTPHPEEYVRLVLGEVEALGIKDRSNLQSFDLNILHEIKKQSPSTIVSYLVENKDSAEDNLKKINFKPEIYSPYFLFLNKEVVDMFHAKGIKVIPWTVNEVGDMKKLIEMGVDGIITDYPNRIAEALK